MDKSNNKNLRLMAEFFLNQIKRFWFVVLIMTIAGAGAGGAISAIKYEPEYSATQVFSIDLKDVAKENGTITDTQLSKTVPNLFSSDVFMDHMQPYIDEQKCFGRFMVYSISSTNLFGLYVVAPSNKNCQGIIDVFKEHYSEVADDIIGESELNYFTDASMSALPSNSPNYAKFIIAGAVIGFALILAILLLKSRIADPITSQADAEELINSTCLTAIKTIKTKRRSTDKKVKKHKMPLLTDADCPLELQQSISHLATKIDAWCNENSQNTILFTSTISGEGKSSIAINTAIELANKGKSVVIVDADLRSPSVNSYLGLNDDKNRLTSLLNNEISLDDSIVNTNEIAVLSNSQPDSNAFENVTGLAFSQKIEILKNRFDYVIIDSPPVGILGDAITISDCADGFVYVISFNYVSKSSVQNGLYALTGSNSRSVGFVLNYEK